MGQVELLHRLLEQARLQLIQTDGRNRLIHTPRSAKRSKSLEFFDAHADEVFELLVRERKPLTFAPAPDDQDRKKSLPNPNSAILQTTLSPEGLQKRLLSLFRDGKTLEEEQGVNILYLAVGFLRWFEDESSEVVREAPLVLLPVALVRNSSRSSFRLTLRDEDISINLPLQERLKDFGITLPDMPDSDDWLSSHYFKAVSKAISTQPRWSIDRNGIMLGFFSFSKFLMFRDLDPSNWPSEYLLQHPILNALLVDGFPTDEPLFSDERCLDDIFDPAELIHVVDADASQALAIETVRRGRNLVIQGPPGTGKSQTITNIIAASIYDGKKVLFVAEKMAALDVVHRRLIDCGLGAACLELHSRHANKREVIQRLDQTLKSHSTPGRGDQEIQRLRDLISYLNKNATRLNTPVDPSGVTPFRALGEQVLLLSEGHAPPRETITGIETWTEANASEAQESIRRLSTIVNRCGSKLLHPWRGMNAWNLQPADLIRLRNDLEAVAKSAGAVAAATDEISNAFVMQDNSTIESLPAIAHLLQIVADRPNVDVSLLRSIARAPDLQRLARTMVFGKEFLKIINGLHNAFSPEAWDVDFHDIKNGITLGVNSWVSRLRRPYRRASKKLSIVLATDMPKSAKDRLDLVEGFIRAQELRKAIEREDHYCQTVLGGFWKKLHTNFDALEKGLSWTISLAQLPITPSLEKCATFGRITPKLVDAFRAAAQRFTGDLAKLHSLNLDIKAAFGVPHIGAVQIAVFVERAKDWLTNFRKIEEWIDLARADRLAHTNGVGSIADGLANNRIKPDQAIAEFRFIRAEAIWNAAISSDPLLAELSGSDLYKSVEDFKKLEASRRAVLADQIRTRHRASLPKDGQELQLIRHEIGKQRAHLATRRLVERAPKALTDIKPVFLMSPISVAQFLPPGKIEFDLLVIDEASQVRPEDALGAIARSKQIVIVGDKKQLPPTSFFDRVLDDLDEDDSDELFEEFVQTTALESVLSACEARGISSRMLTWHYRSRHPSLIEVSNDEFYDNRLFLPPSPNTTRGKTGLVINRVDGSYDRGGKRTNEIEARAVVNAIAAHAREYPDLSLGVVTFSISQRDLIDDFLELRRREDSELDAFASKNAREMMFVKNLENVQGDERDAIIISIGYGPRIANSGLDSMHFGPVSTDGGERRLNVLFTRARARCEVFASFSSGDIDLARTTKPGPRVLKRFMRFAETGILDVPLPVGDPDSPFEEAVGRFVRTLNYEFDFQVGSAGFIIDLAVKHPDRPGEYILAIECDGATYHSARWARERDRLRQQVLEDKGWHFHRIWSTDWFRNPENAKARLAEAIEVARIRSV